MLVLSGMVCAVLGIAATWPVTVKIMPLGDSITEGVSKPNCYRLYLDSLLHAHGRSFDFVGSLSGTAAGPATGFDANHEGHWGMEADWILPQIGGWMRAYRPDVVLMHLGTNDILHETDSRMVVVNRTLEELSTIIDTLRAVNPAVTVFWAKLIPDAESADHRTTIDSLNARIAVRALAKSTVASRIVVVDQHTGFDWTRDLFDAYHPNATGARKMAAKWYAALDAYFTPGTTRLVSRTYEPCAAGAGPLRASVTVSARSGTVRMQAVTADARPIDLRGRECRVPAIPDRAP